MTFAFLVAGLAESFLFPPGSGARFESGSRVQTHCIKGALLGPVMNLCSACIVPVSSAFRRRGGGIEGAIAMVQGSATMNIPALAMVFFVFTPMIGASRLVMAVVGALVLGPIVVMTLRQPEKEPDVELPDLGVEVQGSWTEALSEGFRDWARTSIGYLVRLGPIMVVAGFASGLAIQWISPDTVARYFGNDLQGVATAATLGILINVPLLFEIPLVALGLMLGMGTGPRGRTPLYRGGRWPRHLLGAGPGDTQARHSVLRDGGPGSLGAARRAGGPGDRRVRLGPPRPPRL